jgi:hypothetical protein
MRAHGISVGAWNTKPSRRPAEPVTEKSAPHQDSDPALGAMRPAIRLSSVVLPQPEGPSSVRNSPARMSRSTGASARVPFAKTFSAPAMATIGAPTPSSAERGAVRAGPSRC